MTCRGAVLGIGIGIMALVGVVASCGTGDATESSVGELVFPVAENAIANPSFEVASSSNPARPASWTPSAWGTNATTFTYATDGHTGGRSGLIEVTSHSSGDAKWVFDSAAVTCGTTYIYRDYYRSNVPTKVVVASKLVSGATAYQTLGIVPPSGGQWAAAAFSFTPASNVASVTVYHLISAVGTLQLDDVSLTPPESPDLSSGVPNGSLEQPSGVDPQRPLAWRSDAWGINQPTFTYATTGHTGTRSVLLSVSSYSSGDAKWYFEDQPVTPGTVYLFSDYYMASTASFIIVRARLANGSYTYINLGTVPPSASYRQAYGSFVAPAGAVSATVFHGLAAVGTLQLDDAALSVVPVTMVNGVPNGSLEQSAFPGATLPLAWRTTFWGTNERTFSYYPEGHSGNRSVRIDMTSYTSGSSAWTFDPQPVIGGRAYRVGDYYRSDVDTDVVAQVTLTDGSILWQQLPVAFAASEWAPYSAVVHIPPNGVSLTVYHRLHKVGYLKTDDYSLLPKATLPFARGLVSLTFDDAWRSVHQNALPVLSRHGAVATHYLLTGAIGESEYLTLEMAAELKARGHEIASHTVSHSDLTTLSAAELTQELQASKGFLEANGLGPITDFASPYGLYNAAALAAMGTVYASHRTVDAGYNTKDDFDPSRLKVQNVRSTTTAAEVESWVAQAAQDRSWLILVYHEVAETGGGLYSTTPAALEAHLTAIESHGLAVVTVDQALAELVPQL